MPKPRGQQRKKYKVKYRTSTEDSEIRYPANWTKDRNHKNWLYLYHARKKRIEADNLFVQTRELKYLTKSKLHNFKRKKILFEGVNLYEETVEELQQITTEIAIEIFPKEEEQIGKTITRTAIQELWDYSSNGEAPENPIKITEQSNFTQRFEELLDTPKINKNPTLSLDQITQTLLTEVEKTQRIQKLQEIRKEVDNQYSELDLLILALAAEDQQQTQTNEQQQPNLAVERPVATESFQLEDGELISTNTRSRKRQRMEKN